MSGTRVVAPPEPKPRREAAPRATAHDHPHRARHRPGADGARGVRRRARRRRGGGPQPDRAQLRAAARTARCSPVERIEAAPGEWGDRLYCVLAEARASRPGDEAWAAIGLGARRGRPRPPGRAHRRRRVRRSPPGRARACMRSASTAASSFAAPRHRGRRRALPGRSRLRARRRRLRRRRLAPRRCAGARGR